MQKRLEASLKSFRCAVRSPQSAVVGYTRDENRTRKSLSSRDFESRASTNSAPRAWICYLNAEWIHHKSNERIDSTLQFLTSVSPQDWIPERTHSGAPSRGARSTVTQLLHSPSHFVLQAEILRALNRRQEFPEVTLLIVNDVEPASLQSQQL